MECIRNSGIKTVSIYEYIPHKELTREEMLGESYEIEICNEFFRHYLNHCDSGYITG